MTHDADCIFCRIVSGEIPTSKVFETPTTVAFRDLSPQAPTHILVIPKEHTPSVFETEDSQIFADVLTTARDIARQADLSDFRLAINNGPSAGQTVFHLHVHLLSGRKFQWPPG